MILYLIFIFHMDNVGISNSLTIIVRTYSNNETHVVHQSSEQKLKFFLSLLKTICIHPYKHAAWELSISIPTIELVGWI